MTIFDFDGVDDYVAINRARFYNRALSASEIACLYEYQCWFFYSFWKKIRTLRQHIKLWWRLNKTGLRKHERK